MGIIQSIDFTVYLFLNPKAYIGQLNIIEFKIIILNVTHFQKFLFF